MEAKKSAIEIVEFEGMVATQETQIKELADLSLALVGGGTGDVII